MNFLKFFICWSYMAAGHNINTWRSLENIEKPKKQKNSKKKNKENLNEDMVLALAISVSEDQANEIENEREQEEMRAVLHESLMELHEKKQRKKQAIIKVFPRVANALKAVL